MASDGPIINKVDKSGIITIDLGDYYPEGDRILYDIKDNLHQGLILKEQEFREFVEDNDWSKFTGKYVALNCSADAIVPTWAYMLITVNLEPFVSLVVWGNLDALETVIIKNALSKINIDEFQDARVVVKGCGEIPITNAAYIEITRLLRPVVKSIMYGEPCSTVPLYKKKG
ncbi:DUF2480 family protein [Candidatus Amoebophilus asiaticus]|nr:DUF2480 family protein [Candidatus Amoebophilus asiaticus]